MCGIQSAGVVYATGAGTHVQLNYCDLETNRAGGVVGVWLLVLGSCINVGFEVVFVNICRTDGWGAMVARCFLKPEHRFGPPTQGSRPTRQQRCEGVLHE